MATGILRLSLGSLTLGQRLEKVISWAERIISARLSPYWRKRLAAIAPPAPLRMEALGTWEPQTTGLVKRLLRRGMTMADVGASIGYYTLLAAPLVEDAGHVYAFEPDPRILPALNQNVQVGSHNSRVTIVPAAVTNRPGKARLFLAEPGLRDASLYTLDGDTNHSTEVEATSLDAYFAALGWPRVDLVKMDIEGAERLALDGMRELSQRNLQLKLIVEFCPSIQRKAGVSPDEFFNLLREAGFTRVYAILGDGAGYVPRGRRGEKLSLEPLDIPQDVPRLMSMIGDSTVNLFCDKDEMQR